MSWFSISIETEILPTKVDIQKAYDSVSWDMVIGVLREMNFP